MDRYDRPETLDPPYYDEGDYDKELFGRDQFEVIATRPRALKGRFILSINDVPAIRESFAGFVMHEVSLRYIRYSVGGASRPADELIIERKSN
ncbi:hypothetical protein [Mesorhizobium sp.]|uniref:hypothetical protein n=1 Tax=Mesorhizobium sp. TaxID=1871066 RepID=UPI0026BBEACF